MRTRKVKYDFDLIVGNVEAAMGVSATKLGVQACDRMWELFYSTEHELRNKPSAISARLQLAEMLVGTLHRGEIEDFITKSPVVAARLRPVIDRLTEAVEKLDKQCERGIQAGGLDAPGNSKS